jgi:IMP dehydrogenase/GMP reductase
MLTEPWLTVMDGPLAVTVPAVSAAAVTVTAASPARKTLVRLGSLPGGRWRNGGPMTMVIREMTDMPR